MRGMTILASEYSTECQPLRPSAQRDQGAYAGICAFCKRAERNHRVHFVPYARAASMSAAAAEPAGM